MARLLKSQCCIVGGGPAGMMLGYLLGRAGVKTLVLEKHADFLRDFRGDTVHPSTLRILGQLGLLEAFLKIPHSKLRALSVEIGKRSLKVADFGRLKPPANFIVLMPQWDFLDFLAAQGRRYPLLQVLMSTSVNALISEGGRIVGVRAEAAGGELEVRADLVIGCDGRSSTVRAASGLELLDLGAPIDVLWFRISKAATDPADVLAHLEADQMLVTIDRGDYWQCAYVIAKGGFAQIRAAGLPSFRALIVQGAPFLADRVAEISSFEDTKLLSVSLDRLTSWSKPGLLCIGDAAHAMSPVGGVGINLAIQDAVATANLLAAKLKDSTVRDEDLDAVRRRRLWPVKAIQSFQRAAHERVLKPVISGQVHKLTVPWAAQCLNAIPWLRRWPAQLLGVGLRPEHVRSPLSEP